MTRIKLTPGNGGKDCLYNGEKTDGQGRMIENRCDECDFLLCCLGDCTDCGYERCPRKDPGAG